MQIVLNCFGNRAVPNTVPFDNSKIRKVKINAKWLGETNTNWRKRRIKESPRTRTRGRAIKYVLQTQKERKRGTRLKIPSSKNCENSEFQWMTKL